MNKDFLSILDLSTQEMREVLDLAHRVRRDPAAHREALKGRSLALIFQKPSNRTRVSFETGIFQLGGNAIYLAPEDINLGKREPTSDIARTLERFVDGIVARVFSHVDLEALARFADIPVINALSDRSHPCQALADLMTVEERFGRLKGLKLAYVGDGNNVCHSLMLACAKAGMHMHVATPPGYEPSQDYVAMAGQIAAETGVSLTLGKSPDAAVAGAHVIYTDTWVSMGQEEETAKRLKDFEGFQVNRSLCARADKEFVFLHCLPAHRGQEVESEVIDGDHSLVFDEAENRLHAQKAVMIRLFSGR